MTIHFIENWIYGNLVTQTTFTACSRTNVEDLKHEAGGPSSTNLTSVRGLLESMQIHIFEGKELAAFFKELWGFA